MTNSPENNSKIVPISDAVEIIADQHGEHLQSELFREIIDGIISRKKELLEQAKEGGAQKFDSAMANAIADESMTIARQEMAQKVANLSLTREDTAALAKVLDSNLEAIAGHYFPQALQSIELKNRKLSQKALRVAKAERKLASRETKIKRQLEEVAEHGKRQWALKLWFWKELTSNILVIQIFLLLGLAIGFISGVQIPEYAMCKEKSICSLFRFTEKKLY